MRTSRRPPDWLDRRPGLADGVDPNGVVVATAAGLETCRGGGNTLAWPEIELDFDFGFDCQKVPNLETNGVLGCRAGLLPGQTRRLA